MSTESIIDHFLNFVFNFLKPTFRYQSLLWENHETFNLSGGETGFDGHETKLPTYWNTSFSKICLGMKIHGQEKINFTVINKTADSLYSLIADRKYRATSLGRDTWKALISPQASLQLAVTRKVLMLSVSGVTGPKRESVSLVTTETTAIHVTPELDLVLKESLMTTGVERKLNTEQTKETSLSKPWDIS